MRQRRLADLSVGAIGLGGMPMSIEGRPDRSRSIATIHAALDAGVTLVDTADAYHVGADEVGHNEALDRRGAALVGRDASSVARRDQGRPPAPRRRVLDDRRLTRATSAARRRSRSQRLGVDCDRPLPVPPPGPEGAVRRVCRRAGRPARRGQDHAHAGISNASVAQIDEANEVLGGRLASVQNQFSPGFRSSRGRARPLRAARHRLPAVEPARRHLAARPSSGRVTPPSRRWRGRTA